MESLLKPCLHLMFTQGDAGPHVGASQHDGALEEPQGDGVLAWPRLSPGAPGPGEDVEAQPEADRRQTHQHVLLQAQQGGARGARQA